MNVPNSARPRLYLNILWMLKQVQHDGLDGKKKARAFPLGPSFWQLRVLYQLAAA